MTFPEFIAPARRILAPANTLTLSAFLLMPLAVAAPLGLAPQLAGTAALLLLGGDWGVIRRHIDRPVAVALAALSAWAAVSCLWTPDPAASARGVLQLTTTMALGVLCFAHAVALDSVGRRRVALGLLAGMALALAGLAAVILQARLNSGDSYVLHLRLGRFSRGTVFMALAVLPVLAAHRLLKTGRWVVLLPAAAALVVAAGSSGIGKLCLAAGLVLAGLTWAAPRLAPRLLMVGMAAAIAVGPLLAGALPTPQETADRWPWLGNSAHHRLTIWKFTGRHIAQHPLRGWGFDGSRHIPGADDEVRVVLHLPSLELPVTEAQLPLHPHNCTLQWWLELGAVGAVLAALLLAAATRAAARAPGRMGRALAVGFVGTAFVMAQASFGAWQSWWLCGLWLLAGLTAAFLREDAT